MSRARQALLIGLAALIALVVVFGMILALALATPNPYTAHAAIPHAVALGDATAAPTALYLLHPGQRVTRTRQCAQKGAYWTNTSAYTWKGAALGAQRWTRDRTLTYWPAPRGRVTFDGITFTNRTRDAVLVAGWCD